MAGSSNSINIMVRKLTLMLFVVFFYATELSGQCIADAGKDTIVCYNFGNYTQLLGGSPTAINGTSPYTYTWEASYTIGSSTYTASDFLDDTTLANPEIVAVGGAENIIFYLTVTDDLGNICTDNIKVRFSYFGQLLDDKFAYINQGDNVQLYPSIGGGIPPVTYQWSPNYNLSDPNISNPWASPDTSISYVVTILDSAGCQANDMDSFEVYVTPTAIEDINNMDMDIKLYPNPSPGIFNISFNSSQFDEAEVEVLDVTGKLVQKTISGNSNRTINLTDYPKGLYFVKVKIGNSIAVKKVVYQ
jgi:hypothetical protein